jgi:hypothetical protein
MDGVSIVDDEHPLRRALERKRPSRYGELSLPYVVAISEEPFHPGEPAWHRRNLLFGHKVIELRDGQPARSARRTDGTWRGPGAMPQHTRLAAVLFARGLLPWTVDKIELEWWDNPSASQPVPNELIPDVVQRCQLLVDNNGIGEFEVVEALQTPGSILRT